MKAAAKDPTYQPDPAWKGFLRVGGVLFVVSGLAGLVLTLLSSTLYRSGQPSDAMGYLQLFSQNQRLAATDWSLWIVGDFLLIPPTVAMYLVLRPVSKGLALIGTLLGAAYIIYDISVTELNSLTLVSLAQGWAAAGSDALRAPYVAAATYAVAALPIETVFSFAVGAVGWLLWSLVMLRPEERVFGRRTAVAGVVVNVIGILGGAGPVVPAFGIFTFFAAPLTALWFIVIGAQLYRCTTHLAVGAAT